jgi:hypothetical protein
MEKMKQLAQQLYDLLQTVVKSFDDAIRDREVAGMKVQTGRQICGRKLNTGKIKQTPFFECSLESKIQPRSRLFSKSS